MVFITNCGHSRVYNVVHGRKERLQLEQQVTATKQAEARAIEAERARAEQQQLAAQREKDIRAAAAKEVIAAEAAAKKRLDALAVKIADTERMAASAGMASFRMSDFMGLASQAGPQYCADAGYATPTRSTHGSGRVLQVGPRGGRFYINASGNKSYVSRKK
jgi:hypothetical protein